MSRTLNVIKISGRFCKIDADRAPDMEAIVYGGRVFAAQSLNLHPEVPADHSVNKPSLKKMWEAAYRIAYHADIKGNEGVVLPHEGYSPRGELIREAICRPLSEKFGLNVRLQRGIYVLDESKVDRRVRTCLEQGVVNVVRINSDILSFRRAA